MKLLVIGDKARVEKYLPDLAVVDAVKRVVVPRGSGDEAILEAAGDADFIMADAVCPVSSHLIGSMPNLKLIHSEGVAYNLIDLAAAKEHGVVVCNNKGVNAGAVAEQAILLMLACLRDVVNGDRAVCEGRQIQTKERMMVEGVRELGDCKVGFIGFGDIAKATAKRLSTWGCEMVYCKNTPLSPEEEGAYHASYEERDGLVSSCDIVSLHVPVTEETRNMVDAAFLARMKQGSILINTARGEVVDQQALADALVSGHLYRAGLDTLAPEPVAADHILVSLPEEARRRIVFSPHVGGITEGTFYRAHRNVWENIERVIEGREPLNIVHR